MTLPASSPAEASVPASAQTPSSSTNLPSVTLAPPKISLSKKPSKIITYSIIASYLFALLTLFTVLQAGLLAASFSGLLVYSLVHSLSKRLTATTDQRKRIIAVVLISAIVMTGLTLATWGAIVFFQSDAGNVETLLQKMADILDRSREQIPLWLQSYVPASADALRELLTGWLREHAYEAKAIGTQAGRILAHILIGMVIGSMVALHDDLHHAEAARPFEAALRQRISRLHQAFEKIVFAQVRISALNTVITAVFIIFILPLFGIYLSFSKTLILITFFAGLLPVIGNLISNTVMVILGLAYSLSVALSCLIFLIVIHKLEYFLNARIIGSHIQASSWELLIVLLVGETLFGLPGVVAGPVFYAYIKQELRDEKLV